VGALVVRWRGTSSSTARAIPVSSSPSAVIALAGQMAKADGMVSDAELEAFERVFRVPPAEQNNVRASSTWRARNVAGYEAYAAQIARLFVGNPAILEDVLDGLFEIAKAMAAASGESTFWSGSRKFSGFAPMNSAASAPAISRRKLTIPM